jgi:uncharacterized OsmC-like protein
MTQQQTAHEAKIVNGVNTDELMETIRALRENPDLGEFQFRARNQWLGGTHNRSAIKDFYGAGKEDDSRTEPYVFDCDEPPVLAGNDTGANPVEHLLNALAGCVTTTMVAHAASRGIEIESVESELEGDIDVRGFLGLTDDVDKGYRDIRVNFRVKSDAPVEQLKEFATYSPVYNTITNPVRVTVNVEKTA